jgi:serine/threonine-protein kinase HipA
MSDSLEIWLDADFVAERQRVGTLAHDRGTVRFSYEPAWLKHPLSFALDPDLSLGDGAYYPKPEQGNFRIFDDSAQSWVHPNGYRLDPGAGVRPQSQPRQS